MKTAIIFGLLSFLFFLAFLYCLDLFLFLRREKSLFSSADGEKARITRLEEKHKKAKHPQKKNYYLYLVCLSYSLSDQAEKAQRLKAFLRNDFLLGIDKSKL